MSENTQHTPGPYWMARAEDSARFDYAVGAGDGEIAHVAERADALLFKASPEMLAALREAEQWIVAELDGRLPVETLIVVRSAIALAEGRS